MPSLVGAISAATTVEMVKLDRCLSAQYLTMAQTLLWCSARFVIRRGGCFRVRQGGVSWTGGGELPFYVPCESAFACRFGFWLCSGNALWVVWGRWRNVWICRGLAWKAHRTVLILCARRMVEAAGIEPASCDSLRGSRSVRSRQECLARASLATRRRTPAGIWSRPRGRLRQAFPQPSRCRPVSRLSASLVTGGA